MKKHSPKFYNAVLAIGMLMIIVGFLLFVVFSETTANIPFILWPVLLMVCGAVFLYFTMSFTNSSFQLFLGLFLSTSGILFCLSTSNIFPYTLQECWPLSVIFAGCSLFASGYYKHRKILFAYTFSALTLAVLGSFFLFFSLHVVRVSFRRFVAFIGPFVLIAAGIFLVILFLFQKRHRSFLLEDESDEISEDPGFFSEQGENR
jgi:hypothetical protein